MCHLFRYDRDESGFLGSYWAGRCTMKRFVSILVAVAVVTTLVVPNAFAWRDAGAKARGDNTTPFWGDSSKGKCVARTSRSPSVVWTPREDSRKAVASSDTQKSYRRFSYEPASETSSVVSRQYTSRSRVRAPRSSNRLRYLGPKAERNSYHNP